MEARQAHNRHHEAFTNVYLDGRIDGLPEPENIHHNVAPGRPGDRTFRGLEIAERNQVQRHRPTDVRIIKNQGVLRLDTRPEESCLLEPGNQGAIRIPANRTNRNVDIARGTLRTNAVHMPKH